MVVEISLERTIEKNILKYLNNLKNTKAIKWSQNGRQKGNPDILCCWNGLMLLFEVKRPGELPTALQQVTMEEWRRDAKCTVTVVHSVEEVQAIMGFMSSTCGEPL